MKNKSKDHTIVFSAHAGEGKAVTLIKDGNDGSYAVMVTHRDKESRRSLLIALGIVELDDARLIFDRQSKIAFDEFCSEMKGK